MPEQSPESTAMPESTGTETAIAATTEANASSA